MKPMPKSGIHAEIRRLKKKQEAQEASDAGDDGSDLVSSKPKSLKARSSALAAPLKSISQNDVEKWFKSQGWTAFDFQKEAWLAQMNGESGLIQVPTGAGKTYAAFIGALLATQKNNDTSTSGVRILYVTPLRAVTRDIRISLERALMALRPEWRAEDRTGDTTFSAKARQRKNSPEVLVTTPESLSVLLTYDDHAAFFASLDTIIVDEWHEILGNKRGSLLELTLARIRKIKPEVKTWALSATIGNPDEAARVVTGNSARVITGKIERTVNIESLMPERIDTFPWAGSLGLRMAKDLIARLDPEKPTLIFTNTRTQAERWHQTIAQEKPDWIDHLALHHGSLDRDERERVESGLKTGDLSIVVCTSSLDLGVDFAPIEMVVQIGSPKAVARLVQRAGRSAHRPGEQANILFVPTHALELIEISAVRQAIESGLIETKKPVERPLDVMVQHMVTRALGGGFSRHEIFEEIRTAHSFRTVTGADLDWALRFITQGGDSLQAYPAYRKVDLDEDGRYRVLNSVIARTHRMSIGTIDSNATIRLKFQRGKDIGQVEESFIARLKPGDRFLFAGKVLQLIRLNEMEATVKLATGTSTTLPTWAGGRLPFSSPMSAAVRHTLADVANGRRVSVEMDALKPIVMAQEHYSSLPNEEETLIEITQSREGHHAFIYPFEGRLVHEVLGALVAYRLTKKRSGTLALSVNDYGFELLGGSDFPFSDHIDGSLFKPEGLEEDLASALNLAQFAKRKFREIARVAGLVHPGMPSSRKNSRQLQVSAGLLFDVLNRYEPEHPLLVQARAQVLGDDFESERLKKTLQRMSASNLVIREVVRPTPLGFPLIAERLGARLSNESLKDRLEKMKRQWETA